MAPREPMTTSVPSHETIARNPSHFGSKLSPPGVFAGSGIPATAFASIGVGISYMSPIFAPRAARRHAFGVACGRDPAREAATPDPEPGERASPRSPTAAVILSVKYDGAQSHRAPARRSPRSTMAAEYQPPTGDYAFLFGEAFGVDIVARTTGATSQLRTPSM